MSSAAVRRWKACLRARRRRTVDIRAHMWVRTGAPWVLAHRGATRQGARVIRGFSPFCNPRRVHCRSANDKGHIHELSAQRIATFMYDLVKIRDFRAFSTFELPALSRVNLLVGRNNAGKTSLLEAIEMVAWGGRITSLLRSPRRRGEVSSESSDERPRLDLDVRHLFLGHTIREGASFELTARSGPVESVVRCDVLSAQRDPSDLELSPDQMDLETPLALRLTGPENQEGTRGEDRNQVNYFAATEALAGCELRVAGSEWQVPSPEQRSDTSPDKRQSVMNAARLIRARQQPPRREPSPWPMSQRETPRFGHHRATPREPSDTSLESSRTQYEDLTGTARRAARPASKNLLL